MRCNPLAVITIIVAVSLLPSCGRAPTAKPTPTSDLGATEYAMRTAIAATVVAGLVPSETATPTTIRTSTPTVTSTAVSGSKGLGGAVSPTATITSWPTATFTPTAVPSTPTAGATPTLAPEAAKLLPLLLQVSDLPAGFGLSELEGKAPCEEDPCEAYVAATFERRPTLTDMLLGPLSINHNVSRFPTAELAQQVQMEMKSKALTEGLGPEGPSFFEVSAGGLPDTVALFGSGEQDGLQIGAYVLVSCHGQYLSIVIVAGLEGAVSAEDSLALARIALERLPDS